MLVMRSGREDHEEQCNYLPVRCEHCSKLIPQGQMVYHVDETCENIKVKCSICQVEVPRRMLHHHVDFDCEENEVKCRYYP